MNSPLSATRGSGLGPGPSVRPAVVALSVLTLTVATQALAMRPSRTYPVLPGHYGVVYEEVSISTEDSLRLVGWFYPAQDTAGIATDMIGRVVPVPDSLRRPPRSYATLDAARRPTIVLCDGDAGNMADMIFYAFHFFTRGMNVLTFDWRGFGSSADWPIDKDELCRPEFLTDYDAAIDYVKTRPEVDPARIGLLGFSTGAYLSFGMLAARDDIAAFAGRALLTSFDDLLPILHRLDPDRAFRAPEGYPVSRLPIHAAGDVRVPVLLVVGEKDERTPPWMSERVMEKLRGPKELWILPGAGHGGAAAPEMVGYPQFFDRVVAFFSGHLESR